MISEQAEMISLNSQPLVSARNPLINFPMKHEMIPTTNPWKVHLPPRTPDIVVELKWESSRFSATKLLRGEAKFLLQETTENENGNMIRFDPQLKIKRECIELEAPELTCHPKGT